MKLGFFIMPVHPPARNYAETLKEDREAFILADRLGYSEGYCGEHLTDQAENIPNSMMFIATLMGATSQIKLGTAVVNLPHSHPVVTLNTRYVDDDTAQLATFVHEQLHWFLTDHVERAKTNAALTELRVLYPAVPTALPEGAMGERSTYLHLIVCHLELQALTALLGEQSARQQLERWTHYTWVYRTVLTDTERIEGVLRRHGIVVPER